MEKRFKFIRSENPFEGLEDYFFSPEIRVKSSEIRYPLQISFPGWEQGVKVDGLKVRLGYYFELLTQGIHGGRIQQSSEINGDSGMGGLVIEPDVRDDKLGLSWEDKGVSPGECLKLDDFQVAKYAHDQWGDTKKQPLIMYEIYRHGVRKLFENFKKEPLENLVTELTDTIRFGLMLSFDIIVAIHKRMGRKDFTSRYEGGSSWKPLTNFLSLGLNSMLAYPERTLRELGFDSDDFEIKKRRFPKDAVTMNDRIIQPFPILIAKRKNYFDWVSETRGADGEHYLNSYERTKEVDNSDDTIPF